MKIEYREPMNASELDSVFRLRYFVYSEDKNLHTMVSTSAGIDINEFDLNAFHFAAFDGKKAVACIRIITNTETPFNSWVSHIALQHSIVLRKPHTTFPFQHYYPNPDWCMAFINSLTSRKIGEVGKLAIDKNYRKGGVVLNELISSFVNYCKNDKKINTGFGTCTLALERYYRKFGFSTVEGSMPFKYENLPEAVLMRFDD